MTLKELQSQAAAVLSIAASTDGFALRSFTTESGGAPRNLAGVPEVRRSQRAEYNTVANGVAYSGELVVECRNTGTLDGEGRETFVTPCGIVFVADEFSGSASSFDSCRLIPPTLR